MMIGFSSIGGNDEQNILTMELKLIEQKLMANNNAPLTTDMNKVLIPLSFMHQLTIH